MKTSACPFLRLAFALFALVSCETLDPTGFFFLRENRDGTNTDSASVLESREIINPDFIFDTTVLFCAVQLPEGYDWRNDSAYYSSRGTVCFYRNYHKVFGMNTGADARVSYFADKHHIVGEDLYSEYADTRGTFVRKNGSLLLSFNERENLKGLLPYDGAVYTVGQDPADGTVYYRKNGTVLRRLDGGYVVGDFFNPAYGETGALYLDGDKVCFGFVSEEDGGCVGYVIRNGESTRLCSGKKVLDVRSVKGSGKYILYGGYATDVFVGWKTASFYFKGSDMFTAGVDLNGNSVVLSPNRIVAMQEGDDATIYPCDGGWAFVSERYVRSIGDYYLSNDACACRGAGKIWLALTPRSSALKPAIWTDGKSRELDMNGFLLGLKVNVSRSIAKAGTDPPEP